ncbi:MAG: hypothetical protein R6U96_13335 [Promethearchaeia archaeon]
MTIMVESLTKNVEDNLKFINISTEDFQLFEWKPPRSFRSYFLDLNIVKENATENIFNHIDKGNMKITYTRKGKIYLSAGSDSKLQFQIMEAILEYLDEQFVEMFDIDVIFSYDNVSTNIFKPFKEKVENTIKNLDKLDLIKPINVRCRGCNKRVKIYIRKSMIRNAESYPVPLVYRHEGHALLSYIDEDFHVRGSEIVNITG